MGRERRGAVAAVFQVAATALLLGVSAVVEAAAAAAAKKPVELLWVAPWSGAWAGARQMEPAVVMALEQINAHPDVLPGWDLQRLVRDSECSPGVGLVAVFPDLANTSRPLVGIAGPGCSVVAGPVASTAGLFNLVAVSGSAGAFHLSDTASYPYFFRTVAPHATYVPAMIALAEFFRWSRIALITERTAVTMGTMDVFRIAAHASGLNIVVDSVLESALPRHNSSSLETVFENLRWTTARIIYVHGYPHFLRKFFCEALRRGKTGPDVVYIIPGWHPPGWFRRGEDASLELHDCTNAELQQATQGYLSTDRNADFEGSPQSGVLPNGETLAAWKREYAARVGEVGPSVFGAPAFDAIWTWAFALHELLVNQGLSPADLRSVDGVRRTRDVLLDTQFYGASGDVSFASNGDRDGLPLVVGNMQDGVQKLVGVFFEGVWVQEPHQIVWWFDLQRPSSSTRDYPHDVIPRVSQSAGSGVSDMPVPGDGSSHLCKVSSAMTRFGDLCEYHVPTPHFTEVAPSSLSALALTWVPNPSFGGLLSGYSIVAYVRDDVGDLRLQWGPWGLELPPTATSATLWLASSPQNEHRNLGLEENVVYVFNIYAFYRREQNIERSLVRTEAGRSDIHVAGLACLAVDDVGGACGCDGTEYHSKGAPGITPPELRCEPCPEGAECMGRTWPSITALPGWHMMLSPCLIDNDTVSSANCGATPSLHRCAPWELSDSASNGEEARATCPGGMTTRHLLELTRARHRQGGSRESEGLFFTAQCGNGTVGPACKACREGWSAASSDQACVQCPQDQRTSIGIVCALAALTLVAITGVMVALFRCTKGPPMELALRDFILRVEAGKGAHDVHAQFLGLDAGGNGKLELDEFIAFLDTQGIVKHQKQVGAATVGAATVGAATGTPPRRRSLVDSAWMRADLTFSEAAAITAMSGMSGSQEENELASATKLFRKIDADNDESISFKEFMSFAFKVKDGKRRRCCTRKRLMEQKAWLATPKRKATVSILLSYLQILDSFPTQFPEMVAMDARLHQRCRGMAGAGGGATASWATEWLRPALSFVSSISAESVMLTRCAVGPRYLPKLVAMTMMPLAGITCLFVAARVVWRVAEDMEPGTSRRLHWLGNMLNRGNFVLLFLMYPKTNAMILASFRCEEFRTGVFQRAGQQNGTERWLMADPSISCDAGGPGNDTHAALQGYAVVMVVVFVIGMPLFVLGQLWRHISPINRVYITGEDGQSETTAAASGRFGGVFGKYRPQTWYYESVEMVRKLFLGAVIGLLYSNIPILGSPEAGLRLVVGLAFCASAVCVYIIVQPYAEASSTRLQVLIHFSFMGSFSQGLVHLGATQGNDDGVYAECSFDSAHRALQWLPVAYGIFELTEMQQCTSRLLARCGTLWRRHTHSSQGGLDVGSGGAAAVLALGEEAERPKTLSATFLHGDDYRHEHDLAQCRRGAEAGCSGCMSLFRESDQLFRAISRAVAARRRAVSEEIQRFHAGKEALPRALQEAIGQAAVEVASLRDMLRCANYLLAGKTVIPEPGPRASNGSQEEGSEGGALGFDVEFERFSWTLLIRMERATAAAAKKFQGVDVLLGGDKLGRGKKGQLSRSSCSLRGVSNTVLGSKLSRQLWNRPALERTMAAKHGLAERLHAALVHSHALRPPRLVDTQLAMRRMADLMDGTCVPNENAVDRAVHAVLQTSKGASGATTEEDDNSGEEGGEGEEGQQETKSSLCGGDGAPEGITIGGGEESKARGQSTASEGAGARHMLSPRRNVVEVGNPMMLSNRIARELTV